jgi:hypothetical protein
MADVVLKYPAKKISLASSESLVALPLAIKCFTKVVEDGLNKNISPEQVSSLAFPENIND